MEGEAPGRTFYTLKRRDIMKVENPDLHMLMDLLRVPSEDVSGGKVIITHPVSRYQVEVSLGDNGQIIGLAFPEEMLEGLAVHVQKRFFRKRS
jgi:hypothetical protein